jgi:primary-amine oxidase
MVTNHSPHPFDPITPEEIKLAVRILEATFPSVELRYKRIDVNEPIKKDAIAYIEAERLRRPLPPPPARLLYVLFHRLDTGAFYKAILNADKRTIVYAKELPKEVQVSGALLQIVRGQLTVYRDQLMSTKLQPLKKCA